MMRVSFSHVVDSARGVLHGVKTAGDTVKNSALNFFKSLAQMVSVKNSAGSMARNPSSQSLNNPPRQQVFAHISQVTIHQPQTSAKVVSQPRQPSSEQLAKAPVSRTYKRPAPQPTKDMREQAEQLKAAGVTKQPQQAAQVKHTSSGSPLQRLISKHNLFTSGDKYSEVPVSNSIYEATLQLFEKGIASGQFKAPDVVDGGLSAMKMQEMSGKKLPKLAQDNFVFDGDAMDLSPVGKKMANDLSEALSRRENKDLEQMSELQKGLFLKVRARAQRLKVSGDA